MRYGPVEVTSVDSVPVARGDRGDTVRWQVLAESIQGRGWHCVERWDGRLVNQVNVKRSLEGMGFRVSVAVRNGKFFLRVDEAEVLN